jgi:hypothetical protein
MAFCPKCHGGMEAMALACPHCGYDFAPDPGLHRRGLAYSPLADLALVVATIVAAVGSLAALIGMGVALWHREWLLGLVACPVAFLYQFALLVVFVRSQHV